jgi:hypothetical protein
MLGNKGTKKFYRTGGSRGGQDQFKWDDVKTDKQRENYLGHSAMAPVGRWQKGKDILWYTRDKAEQDKAMEAEKESIRKNDEDLLNEALGLKPKKRKFVESNLDRVEIKQLLARGETERGSADVERIEGLGAAPSKTHEHIQRGPTALEKEILKYKEGNHGVSESSSNNIHVIAQRTNNGGSESDSSDDDRKKSKKKSEKKSKKKHKHKEHKKDTIKTDKSKR